VTPPELEDKAKALQVELRALELRLASRSWLAGAGPSAADVAVFPFLATLQRAMTKAEAQARAIGLLPLDEAYPNVGRWMERVETVPGYERTYPPHWRQAG
jgi:glutathione S-transferase